MTEGVGAALAAAGLLGAAILAAAADPRADARRRGGPVAGGHHGDQPRDHHGRYLCEPDYPRLRTSPCGCSAGIGRPCPVGQRFEHVRLEALRRVASTRDEVERELDAIEAERHGVRSALDYARARIRERGQVHHRPGRTGTRAYSVTDRRGEDSERGYAELLEERAQLLNHLHHLDARARGLRADRARGRRHEREVERLFAA